MKNTLAIGFMLLFFGALIFASCEKKEDASSKKVYYASLDGYGGGGNPNPNNNPSTGTTPTNTTTTTSCTKAMTVDGTAGSGVSSTGSSSGTYYIFISCSQGSATINFSTSTAPSGGAYTVVSSGPVASQCTVSYAGVNATAGSVVITTGTTNKITFSSIICGTHTLSATGCY